MVFQVTMQTISIPYIDIDIPTDALHDDHWATAVPVKVERYWNGEIAPDGRHSIVRALWSENSFYFRFISNLAEPLVVAEEPDISRKAMNLWDRDVVEIFVAPNRNESRKYFEFEAAPTGEWLDVALDSTSGTRVSDWNYASGMETASEIEDGSVTTMIKIPWSAFGKKPVRSDVWLGNILRCVGKDPDRGYLAWSPTMTEQPNFHVPERFGEFHFSDS